MNGQADRVTELRRLQNRDEVKHETVYAAFVSGKGGTGKSFLALNTAYALSIAGSKVLLVDYDLQSPNLHIMSNVFPNASIHNFFQSSALLDETLYRLNNDLYCIYGDQQHSSDITISQMEQFFKSLAAVSGKFDIVIFDTGSGIHESLTIALRHMQTAFIVANPEPTSVMDAYVMAKYLFQEDFQLNTSVVINKCPSPSDGQTAYQNLSKALSHFIKKKVECAGLIPSHPDVYQSIMKQELLLKDKPASPMMRFIAALAAQLVKV